MKHTFTRGQLLNITTGRLYTKIDDVYEFFNKVIEDGIFTHQIPNAYRAIRPLILKNKDIPNELLTDEYDPSLMNGPDVSFEFSEEDKNKFWEEYKKLPNLLEGKEVITVKI